MEQSKFATNFLDKTLQEEKERDEILSQRRNNEKNEEDMNVTPSSVLKVQVHSKKKMKDFGVKTEPLMP